MSLASLYSDRVTHVKADGAISRDDLRAVVMNGSIQLHDATLPIESGDHLLRKLPNGMVEDYTVLDPILHSGLGMSYYEVLVRKSTSPAQAPQAAIQNITNIFHGANARVNMNSTDNSTNIASGLDIAKLKDFLAQVKPAVGSLPAPQQTAIAAPLALLESEIDSQTPETSKIAVALQSIKTIVEGASGNLIASGIGAMVGPILTSIL